MIGHNYIMMLSIVISVSCFIKLFLLNLIEVDFDFQKLFIINPFCCKKRKINISFFTTNVYIRIIIITS